jgi:Arc/MetJ-type ribon-helix-helix transcriptional regulator
MELLNVRAPDELQDAIDEEARRRWRETGRRVYRSDVVRDALREYLDVDGEEDE